MSYSRYFSTATAMAANSPNAMTASSRSPPEHRQIGDQPGEVADPEGDRLQAQQRRRVGDPLDLLALLAAGTPQAQDQRRDSDHLERLDDREPGNKHRQEPGDTKRVLEPLAEVASGIELATLTGPG